MPTVINGLPAHILLIHVVIVLVPLGALCTVLSSVWPAARARLGILSPLVCLVALVFVPITTHAGEWLRDHLRAQQGDNPAIDKHVNLASGFLIYAIGLFVVSTRVVARPQARDGFVRRHAARRVGGSSSGGTALPPERRRDTTELPQWASIGVAVVAVAVSAVTVWQLYRIGDSGSHAVWGGIVK